MCITPIPTLQSSIFIALALPPAPFSRFFRSTLVQLEDLHVWYLRTVYVAYSTRPHAQLRPPDCIISRGFCIVFSDSSLRILVHPK